MLPRVVGAIARISWWIWLVAGVALALRLLLVPFGLPYELDPDERAFVDAAWRMAEGGNGDPGWYGHPASTLLDMMAAAYAGYGAIGVATGALDGLHEAGDLYLADVSHFFLIGRLITAISGVVVVLMTYLLALRLRVKRSWALVAALLIAVSPAMIEYSSMVRPDMLLSAFLLVAVVLSMRILVHPSARSFAIAGLAMGLAAASKYPGALAIVPIVVANATLTVRQRITPRRGLVWLGAAVAAAAITAFVVGPFLFLNLGEMIQGLRVEARLTHPGATGSGFLPDMARFLMEAMPWGVGSVTTIVGVVGTVGMALRPRPRVASAAFWGLLAFLSFLSLWWARWAIPLFPLVAVAAVFLLDRTQRRLARRVEGNWLRVGGAALALALVLPLVPRSAELVTTRATSDDIRLAANEWILENVPPGSALLADSYTTQVSARDYDVHVVQAGEFERWSEVSRLARPAGFFEIMATQWAGTPGELLAEIAERDIDYIALSDVWLDVFRGEGERYAYPLLLYETLIDAYPVVARFDSDDGRLGWPVTILAGPGTGAAEGQEGPP